MMRFFKYSNHPSQLAFCGVAALFAAGLLSMSGSALGCQANSIQPDKAQGKAASKLQASTRATTSPTQQIKLPESRIAELRAFAKSHHAEIIPLLDFLEKKRPKKFQKVINGLDRDLSNLERLQKKSDEAYQRGLAAWIRQSRIQLYAAQFKVAADEETAAELREKIRSLIEENLDTRVAQMERDIAHAEARAARLRKVAKEIKAKRDTMIEKRIEAATRNAPKMNKGKRFPAKSPYGTDLKKAAEEQSTANPDAKSNK